MDISVAEFAIALAAVAAGALVQGSTGLGSSLVAAPILVAIDPVFVPAPLIINAQIVGIRNAVAEREALDRGVWRRGMMGAPIGLVAGAAVQATADERSLGIAVGLVTAAAAATLLAGVRASRTRSVDVGVGIVSSTFMLIAGLAGPPAAIGYAEMPPSQLHANFATLMLCIAPFSLGVLVAANRLGWDELAVTAILLPGVGLGLYLARYARPRVDGERFRPLVLGLALAGAIALVLRRL